jgi:type IV secretory pathway TrbD component
MRRAACRSACQPPNQTANAANGIVGANGVVGLQIGYAIADMTAKAGFGVLIYLIARAKSTKTAAHEAYATA